MIKRLIFILLSTHAFPMLVNAAGMDCERASSKVERLICDEKSNPDLYSLDRNLNIFFSASLKQTNDKKRVVGDQRRWLTEVRDRCSDANCLRTAYKSRISQIQESSTLCKSSEVVVFSCTLPKHQVASLCASKDAGPSTGYMQFRLGRNQQAIELLYPQRPTPAKNHFKYVGDDTSDTHAVSFWQGEQRLSVFDTKSNLAVYNHTGVIVSRGHPPVRASYSECMREPVVFAVDDRYSELSFQNLSESLGLPDAGDDISYATGEVESKPGAGTE